MIDPKKAIHLVSSNSARGSLEYYFKLNFPDDSIRIHCIYNNLTTGPLNDLISSSDYEEYISYWKTIDNICMPEGMEKDEDDFQFPDLTTEFSIDFPKDSPLVIWHGNESGEQLMLYRYCHLLKDRDLYEINLNNWPMNPSSNYKTNCLATRNPEDMNGILDLITKIDHDNKTFYAQEWERLKKDQQLNRILQDGKIVSVKEDYYDESILENCTSEYKNAARVIGETMGQQESSIGDHYLFYRVHVLINQKVLEYQGNLTAMRYFEIRKVAAH